MAKKRVKNAGNTLTESITRSVLTFNHLYIGYSGGVDSHVLLHACATLVDYKTKITAVYINHNLQTQAADWAIHCQKIAQHLDVNFLTLSVNAQPKKGESSEEAARNSRYQALKTLLKKNDALLIAQHRDDQLETVLLQLFRGSGLRGLSGIPEKIVFGEGFLIRPFLNIAKTEINIYANKYALNWIEDPTNQHDDYDRNFLRNQVIPRLKQRWQSLDKTVARSATHCATAQNLLEIVAQDWFKSVFNEAENTLFLEKLDFYTRPQQNLIIRQWFSFLGLKMPSQQFLNQIYHDLMTANANRDPVLLEQEREFRRFHKQLYCLKLQKEEFNEQVSVVQASKGILRDVWENAIVSIKPRTGGEKIRLPNRYGNHELKKLFQEAKIPPWQRERIPLIYLNDELAAVGTLWISANFYREKENSCILFTIDA